jgi:FixJ family two-component response regulator
LEICDQATTGLEAINKTDQWHPDILILKTVETHRANLMGKLGIHTPTDLIRYAVRNGIINP